MKNVIKILAITIFLCLGIYLLVKNTTKVIYKDDETIKIGAVIPESGGPVAVFGKWMKQGMDLGIENFEKENPQYKGALNIFYEDSKFDVKEGLNAFNRLRDIKNVDVFISTMSNISKPILEKKPTTKPILLQDVTYPNITEYGENVFRHFVSSDVEAFKLSEFVKNTIRVKSCVLLYQNDETGIAAKKVFDTNISNKDLIYQSIALDGDEMTNKTILMKAIESNPECIILFAYSKPWINSMITLKELGYKGQILTNTAMYINPWRIAIGDASENIVFTHPIIDLISSSGKTFSDDFYNKYNEAPSLQSAYGYDLIRIISIAFLNSKANKTDFDTELYKIKAFEGAFGRVLIPENRDIKTEINISRIINGKIINTRSN